jgi:hypothetical protein
LEEIYGITVSVGSIISKNGKSHPDKEDEKIRQDTSRPPSRNAVNAPDTPRNKTTNQISIVDLIHLLREQTDLKSILSKLRSLLFLCLSKFFFI